MNRLAHLLGVAHNDDFLSEIERLLPDGEFHYLAGPMSNRPSFNVPLFDDSAAFLREQGYGIASPAEFDHEEVRAQLLESSDGAGQGVVGGLWEDCLSRDLVIVCHPRCVGIVLLDEWHLSRGALFETDVADRLQKPLYELHREELKVLWLIDRTSQLALLQENDKIHELREAWD